LRKLHIQDLYDLCPPPNTFRVIKLGRIRWAGHETRMETGEVHTGLLWGDLREIDHLEDLRVDGEIILKWIFNRWDGEVWIEFICGEFF
jgi:hypothetical protein